MLKVDLIDMAIPFLTKIFGSRNDRLLKTYRKTVERINALEAGLESLSDDELKAKTQNFRDRAAAGESLDALLPEAFAVVREGSKRVMKMRHFDVQLAGGIALHNGKIAEMRTGEGKTLTSTLPAYLNAIAGKGVHVVTVNDYLASRDATWMGKLYNFLGLTVGINLPQLPREEKQAAYNADITYGTNNEYGFDYLRDNMVYEAHDRVQRPLNYAIVDEVDSILIDEARTPLIISGQAEDHTATYLAMNQVVPLLTRQEGEADPRTGEGIITPGDFTVDEKSHQVFLTEDGHEKAEGVLSQMGLIPEGASLYDPANITLMHHLNAALRAQHLYHRDQHYVVQDGEIVIVDEFTGRLMTGRRWSDGLHQAVEAKEGVQIQAENQTLASITFQNYFRLYNKIGGMTGTADTEAYEFQEIYGLETVVIPPHRKSQREDQLDRVYKTSEERYTAAIADIRECHERGQPVLVGTTSIENSELISEMLTKAQLPHQVLNAKQHTREASIVTQAGRIGSVTVATNMAGRGVDIMLGGNPEGLARAKVLQEGFAPDTLIDEFALQMPLEQMPDEYRQARAAAQKRYADLLVEYTASCKIEGDKVRSVGGLYVLGTERHESRRIDNQLRGRSGRQGDPGESRFYLSLDDELMRLFATGALSWVMGRALPDDEAIEAKMVTKAIERAQTTVEQRNGEIRKNVLKYDEVMNEQRKIIYLRRDQILQGLDLKSAAMEYLAEAVDSLIESHCVAEADDEWDIDGLVLELRTFWPSEISAAKVAQCDSTNEIYDLVMADASAFYAKRETEMSAPVMREVERQVMLKIIDQRWREHLEEMDYLQEGINLRAIGQKDPLIEWQREGFEMFGALMKGIAQDFVKYVMHVQVINNSAPASKLSNIQQTSDENVGQAPSAKAATSSGVFGQPDWSKTPRNAPCPCGSGKKYKMCHGRVS